MRRFTPVEIAIGVALTGVIAAVAIPTFLREVQASHFVEPVAGLTRLGVSAIACADVHDGRFPDSAPLTPAVPPRGKKDADPPGAWDHPTWQALAFRAAPDGVPHAYAFAFEGLVDGHAFVARAHGDLDGDGVLSTFEIRGAARIGERVSVEPGMYIEAELE